MKTIKFFSILMAVAIIFNSCSKGDTGATGPQGPQGTAGANGVSNITSTTFTVTTWSGSSTEYFYSYQNFNLDWSGGVEVYWYDATLSGWFTLPYSVNNISQFTEVWPNLSNVWVYVTDVDGTTAISNPGTQVYKVINIPAQVIVKHPNTNWNNYSEVKAIIDAQKIATN